MTIEITSKHVVVEEVTITCSKSQLLFMRNAAANEHNSLIINRSGFAGGVWVARCRKIVDVIDETGILAKISSVKLHDNDNQVDPQWDDDSGIGTLD